MTQAFNLSQLAQGVNTAGQLNAASYLYNQVPVANGGTALSSAGAAGNMLLASSASAYSAVAMPTFGYRNRIINGGMQIDQRNAGASVTFNDGVYSVDRFQCIASQTSKATAQQNAGSVTPPTGFKNYLGITSSSAYSVVASDVFAVVQKVEGLNTADLAFGTASAATVTLSFWVRSSLTGTFGGSLGDSGLTRAYPYSYTINAANTWEYKTITIPGDTSGTWLTDTGIGFRVYFALGAGATYSGTAGAWTGSPAVSATGATSVVGTNGATFYVTGVQLEKGAIATAFDVRSYGAELALCQRYFQKATGGVIGYAHGTTLFLGSYAPRVTMRAFPTYSLASPAKIDEPFVTNFTQSSANVSNQFGSVDGQFSFCLGNFSGLSDNNQYILRDDGGAVLFTAEL